MPEPLFEFFEVVAGELTISPKTVITNDDLSEQESPLLENLSKTLKPINVLETIPSAVNLLRTHFQAKGADLPFDYAPATGEFTSIDTEFLSFVEEMRDIRSIGKKSRDFEQRVAQRLALRATGSIHRVGHPRQVYRKSAEFNTHLKTMGFVRPVLVGKDKDGGLDILWQLPVGTIPHRPFVSVQCKNGEYDWDAAQSSLGTASTTFSQHSGLQCGVHIPCVLFNDYLSPERLTTKQLNFVPLGLTDLSRPRQAIAIELL